jgi:hypothetical protein
MHTDQKSRRRVLAHSLICVHLCSSVALFVFSGCSTPNKANITLRKQNQDLREELEAAGRTHAGDLATIASLRGSAGITTTQSLAEAQIEKLFTTHGLKLGKLTGGARTRADLPYDDAIKVYAVPTDEGGDELKAAGSFVVSAFDLADAEHPLIGQWEFGADEVRKLWYGDGLLYNYVLTAPLPRAPKHDELTIRVAFTDSLTGRKFEAERKARITLANAPATHP